MFGLELDKMLNRLSLKGYLSLNYRLSNKSV
jgi:hypothetical protein